MIPQEIQSNLTTLNFFDTFDKPKNWTVGKYSDEYSVTNQKIYNGSYLFDIDLIKQGFVQRFATPSVSLRNFYFQVDIKQTKGSTENDCYGIAFRDTGVRYYLLEVCDNKYSQVLYDSGSEWITIREWGPTSMLQVGKANRIGVLARDNQFNVYINNQLAYSFKDSKLPNAGFFNLAVSVRSVQKSASFEFDNVIILEDLSKHSESTLLPALEKSPQNIAEVIVDAKEKWVDTGLNVSEGDRITIAQSSGSWTADLGDFEFVDANGYFTDEPVEYFCPDCDAPIKDGVLGILVAKIGGSFQAVGNNKSFYAKESGGLMLMMNDAYQALDDNDGSVTVNITVSK